MFSGSFEHLKFCINFFSLNGSYKKQTKKTNTITLNSLCFPESAAEKVIVYCHFANKYIDILTFIQPFKHSLQRAADLEMSQSVLKEEILVPNNKVPDWTLEIRIIKWHQ